MLLLRSTGRSPHFKKEKQINKGLLSFQKVAPAETLGCSESLVYSYALFGSAEPNDFQQDSSLGLRWHLKDNFLLISGENLLWKDLCQGATVIILPCEGQSHILVFRLF